MKTLRCGRSIHYFPDNSNRLSKVRLIVFWNEYIPVSKADRFGRSIYNHINQYKLDRVNLRILLHDTSPVVNVVRVGRSSTIVLSSNHKLDRVSVFVE